MDDALRQAAAVATDIGGPLSHSSIVAREYGIPAVLGTGVATLLDEAGEDRSAHPRLRVGHADAGTALRGARAGVVARWWRREPR